MQKARIYDTIYLLRTLVRSLLPTTSQTSKRFGSLDPLVLHLTGRLR